MQIVSYLFAILAGGSAAVLVISSGSSFWVAALVYSLVGAVSFILALAIFAYWSPNRPAAASLALREPP